MKIILGWVFTLIALGISVYANYNCSFGCQGVYGQIINPLSVAGFISFFIGMVLIILSALEQEELKNKIEEKN